MERDRTGSDFLLTPKIRRVEMPDFAKSSTPANAERRSGISVDSNANVHTEIASQALKSETMGNASRYSVELSFARGQSYG